MAAFSVPDLAGKVFLVTGASTGIGAAVARGLAAQGARVAVHYNASRAKAEAVVADIAKGGGEGLAVAGDLSRVGGAEPVVDRAATHFGRLDGLINNAGSLVKRVPIADFTEALYDEVMNLNVRAVVAASRAAIPHLRKAGGGAIVNTTSIAARHGGGPGAVMYASSKGFVSTFTRGLAKELVKDNIRVNAVSPGVIATPFHERFSTAEQIKAMTATIPMGRLGSSEECVGTYLYLASAVLSGYVTGQVIEVNGGQLMP
ncbi:MAG: SDR family oxidoreductase [Alphaproteobacteria bacterium]|nr:SDR family oxidoreductase [Alphaproteobacteria bacterium]